jgi:hypothetical protein
VSAGQAQAAASQVWLSPTVRPRIINDDAVRLVDDKGRVVRWAYFLPRDALHKYQDRNWEEGRLWVSVTKQTLDFSRPFHASEDGLDIQVPVMREPKMFRLPGTGTAVAPAIRKQLIDFDYPDVVIARAAYYYAQTDPVMQPRVQTLEAVYKDLLYNLIERDTRNTDSPFVNETIVPVQNGLIPDTFRHWHPHAN